MKIKKFYILFLFGLITFITFTAYVSFDKNLNRQFKLFGKTKVTDNKSIIKFNHALHLKDAGLQCKDCHNKAAESVKASDNLNPVKKDCESCHDVKDQKTCNLCHYDGIFKKLSGSNKEINFSHKFHLSQGKQCTDCHTGLDKVKLANESAGAFPNMELCYTCHNTQKATNNCEACHTKLTSLKPVSHLNSNFLNEHKVINDASGKKNDNCMMCHSDNYCQVCHQATGYKGQNTPKDFYAPYYTKESGQRIERDALQKLNNVHSFNYLYTHGLDANHKSFECKTCHDPGAFCVSCHQNGGNLQTGFVPKSHLRPNFTTLGVNTGGGLHAELAKKDIESCESCHSVQGGDPACVKCHFDNNGVKGTHPRTHETGFLRDEHGIWHNTQGAICYTCHTDGNARPNGKPGIGFCGYCHGTNPK